MAAVKVLLMRFHTSGITLEGCLKLFHFCCFIVACVCSCACSLKLESTLFPVVFKVVASRKAARRPLLPHLAAYWHTICLSGASGWDWCCISVCDSAWCWAWGPSSETKDVEGLAQGQPAYTQLRAVGPCDVIPTVCGPGVQLCAEQPGRFISGAGLVAHTAISFLCGERLAGSSQLAICFSS